MPLTIGVPRETYAGEKRVATVPDVVQKLVKLGFAVKVESGAGDAANLADDTYVAAGATIAPDAAALYAASDIVFKVRPPTPAEVAQLKPGATLIGFVWPAQNPDLMQAMAARGLTVLAIDSLPRQLSRAQKMDALTSMAGVSGYRAVVEAANAFGRFFNGQITAAGKIPPARVFIAGAGVAGLAAIGTAANLGAIVRANDTRAEVADQVTSLGGEFVKVDYEEEGSGGGGYAKVMSEGFQQAQREMYAREAKDADITVCRRARLRRAAVSAAGRTRDANPPSTRARSRRRPPRGRSARPAPASAAGRCRSPPCRPPSAHGRRPSRPGRGRRGRASRVRRGSGDGGQHPSTVHLDISLAMIWRRISLVPPPISVKRTSRRYRCTGNSIA